MTKLLAETVINHIYLSYANLAMAHSAVVKNQSSYGKLNYMIRSRLLKGLRDGKMNIRTIFDDEKVKLMTGKICNYCGSSQNLALDHIFPQRYGGKDDAENLIFACRKCNSSKGKKDLLEWMKFREQFLPLMIIRRYLKLTYTYCRDHELLEKRINDIIEMELPFKIEYLPINFPSPDKLVLNANEETCQNTTYGMLSL
ncbi:MAG: HNH endonuclease [Candidatus Cloacimonetes bacterium]|nr:HNH endonuclease [Candidatus Cloacimonadota bacterium]